MHNPPTPPPPSPSHLPPQTSVSSERIDTHPFVNDESWDWSNFLDFDLDPHLQPSSSSLPNNSVHSPPPVPPPPPPPPPVSLSSPVSDSAPSKIRKRDPRMSCENYHAGLIPCACPEIDAIIAAEDDEEESGGTGKKRAKKMRAVDSGILRCQVPGCEVDISELKGYHKRHRICIRCANLSDVLIEGLSKRYCQQCGKFHILSDFDEGKRSCRRKLERHNNRRRRKPSDSKGSVEREPQQAISVEGASIFHKSGKDNQCTSSQAVEENTLEAEGLNSLSCSVKAPHVQSDSIGSGETQTDEDKQKYANSPFYRDDKSAFSSECPTGRISFKLYDWNPAEFPRRLRHQIFQWLASMPVELEGYIRPGCTILTLFIAMPKFMWFKLDEDPVACISDLVVPRNLLSGRGTFYVYLNNMMVSVMKGGTSIINAKVKEHAPKLHYVHPICFEAGEPMQFVVCGSNLLQPKFQFLVSFAGKYLKHDVGITPPCDIAEYSPTAFDHQLVNVCVPHTEYNTFGPGFIEVENESGLSNFIPILIADKEICTEIKTMQRRLDLSLFQEDSQSISSLSNEILKLKHKKFAGFISDIAWLLKDPTPEIVDFVLTTSQLQRFTGLLKFLIENESIKILERVLYYMKTWVDESVSTDIPETEMGFFQETMNQATVILGEHLEQSLSLVLHSKHVVPEVKIQSSRDVLPATQFSNQGMEVRRKLDISVENIFTGPILNGDGITSVRSLSKERPKNSFNRVYLNTNQSLKSQPIIFVIVSAAVCVGISAVLLHPHKFIVTIRSCLWDIIIK